MTIRRKVITLWDIAWKAIAVSRERHAAARAAIARLRPADAEIIMLKYADGFNYRQIAACLGITEKAVDRRLARARENLRRQLIRWGIYETEP